MDRITTFHHVVARVFFGACTSQFSPGTAHDFVCTVPYEGRPPGGIIDPSSHDSLQLILLSHCGIGEGLSQRSVNEEGRSRTLSQELFWKSCCFEVWGGFPDMFGPWLCMLLDGQAAWTLEALDIKGLAAEGGEEVVFPELDERFHDKTRSRRLSQVGARLLFTRVAERWRRPFVGGSRMLDLTRICRPGSIGRATVTSATHSWGRGLHSRPHGISLDVHLTACHTGAVAAAESEVDLQAEGDWETVV